MYDSCPPPPNFFHESRRSQRVELRRTNGDPIGPFGIYRCDIPTISVHNAVNISVRESIFIGLYSSKDGDVMIIGGIEYTEVSDIKGPSPQFTLTCISTGGPATTVTWTRDSVPIGISEMMLVNNVTSLYTHTLTILGRLPGLYRCTVANNKPSSASTSRQITLKAPSGSLETFKAEEVGKRQVVLSWYSQTQTTISNYTLSCTPLLPSLPQSLPSQSVSFTVAGFSPNTLYSCSLVARNVWGNGTPAITNFTTKDDYMYIQLKLKGVLKCSEVIVLKTEMKLEDVSSKVVEVLKQTCSECDSSLLDKQSFSCYEETPLFVTYRARLEGTTERDSSFLVSLIEDWVRGGASVIVTGVMMTVDSDCPVIISSLSDQQCSPTSAPPTCNCSCITSAITGVVVSVVTVLLSLSTVILMAIYHRNCYNKSKTRQSSTIHTTVNTAYVMNRVPPLIVDGNYEVIDEGEVKVPADTITDDYYEVAIPTPASTEGL